MAIALQIRLSSNDHHSTLSTPSTNSAVSRRRSHPHPLPAPCATDVIDVELQRIGTSITYPRGKMLVCEGDAAEYLFKVDFGTLRVVRLLADGRRYIVSFLMPGDYFGLADLEQYSNSVEAVLDARVIRYPRRAIESIIGHDARVGRQFFFIMSKELSTAQDRFVLFRRKSALERLAAFLLILVNRQSADRNSNAREVEFPMSRSDVADYLGLRIETVSRILGILRKQGIITVPDAHSFILLDRIALNNLCESAV